MLRLARTCALAEDGALPQRAPARSGGRTYDVELLLEGLRRLASLVSDTVRADGARAAVGHTLTTDLVRPFQDIVGECGRVCESARHRQGVLARRERWSPAELHAEGSWATAQAGRGLSASCPSLLVTSLAECSATNPERCGYAAAGMHHQQHHHAPHRRLRAALRAAASASGDRSTPASLPARVCTHPAASARSGDTRAASPADPVARRRWAAVC